MAINTQSDIAINKHCLEAILEQLPKELREAAKHVIPELAKKGLIRTDKAAEYHFAHKHKGTVDAIVGSDITLADGRKIEVKTTTARYHGTGGTYDARVPLSAAKESADFIMVLVFNPEIGAVIEYEYPQGDPFLYATKGKNLGKFKSSLEIPCERKSQPIDWSLWDQNLFVNSDSLFTI